MKYHYFPAIVQALLAAGFFGASAPFAKILLCQLEPVTLAALLYLGSGFGALAFNRLNLLGSATSEAPLTRAELGWLAGAIIAGGIIGAILQLVSLRSTPAATASLLLNFEGVATTLIAVLVFKEAISRRAVLSILCVTAASIILSWDGSGQWGISVGALGILLACLFWGIDNNLTRNISAKNPLTIVIAKGLVAGSFSLLLTLLLGNRLPGIEIILGALFLGALSYGLSLILFIRAMRGLGAARTSALFGTAPLIGVALSLVIFRDPLTPTFLIALLLMTVGTVILLNEDHQHIHFHALTTHEHRHRHDDAHHDHTHPTAELQQAHSHLHTHQPTEHQHAHMPDTDHRHTH